MSAIAAAALRLELVEQLQSLGALRHANARDAFLQVPRELFLPGLASSEGMAAVYANRLVVTKADARGAPLSSSSEPQVTAAMLEALDVEEGMRILEIGTGTGYNAALLKTLVGARGRVVSVELDSELARSARNALRTGGYPVRVVCADGHDGYSGGAPYDRILVAASTAQVPRAWLDQLVEGGLLEVPLRMSAEGSQAIATLRRRGDRLESVAIVPGRFMPLRGTAAEGGGPPVLTVRSVLGNRRRVLTRLSGPGLGRLSPRALRALVGIAEGDPRRRSLRIRFPSWSLGLYLTLEIPDGRLVMRYADLALGVVDRSGRSLALVDGRWEGGERPTPQRLLAHGEPQAEEVLSSVLEQWTRRGRPGRERLRLTVDFTHGRSRIAHSWTSPVR